LLLSVAGLMLIASALAGVPLLSMRLLVFGANGLAVLGSVRLWLLEREPVDLMQRHVRALRDGLDALQRPLPPLTSLMLLLLHAGGLLAWCVQQRRTWGLGAALLLSLLSPQILNSLRLRRWRVDLEALAPLILVYTVLLLGVLVLAVAKLWFGFPHFFVPPPWDSWLNPSLVALLAVPWAVSLQVHSLLRSERREYLLLRGVGATLMMLTLLWASWTYLRLRTHGVTGSDPYCYAQMAIDMVQHGVPVHRFPWVRTMQQLGVFGEAGVHLGYHLPFAADRSATVWPIGQSLLLAAGHALGGEVGLYVTTPLLGLCSLLALAVLSWELLVGESRNVQWSVTGLAVFLLATSYAQIERLVVPMADAAAQLFTTLTIVLWVRTLRAARGYLWAALAGLAFAAAYWARHTQLVVGLAVVAYAALQSLPSRRKTALLAVFSIVALLAALPDLWYHRWVMGHWLTPESLELRHFGWGYVGATLAQMVRELLSAREFLLVAPLVLYGAWRLWRERRKQFVLLGSWLVSVLVVHLPYEALRLRDLLSIFPVLCWWAGYGASELWPLVQPQLQRLSPLRVSEYARGFFAAMLLAGLLLLRSEPTLSLATASDIDSFGHLNAFQRVGFARIGQDTEPNALIGASLNSGAVELHGGRATFRPAVWQSQELYTFLDHVLAEGWPVYFLQDGLEMRAALAAARQHYTLQWVGRYDIPFYHYGGGSSGGRVTLWRLDPGAVARRTQ
jgi:hypothetical protein